MGCDEKVASNPIVKAAVPFALGVAAPYAMPYLQKGMDVVGRYTGDKLYNHYHPTVGSKVADVASDIGSNIVDAVSNVGSNIADTVTNIGSAFADNGVKTVRNLASMLWPFGKKGEGYGGRLRRRRRGRARFRKGSPEAKAYMAMLRARRRGKRGRGYMGGMVKRWNLARLGELLAKAEYTNAPDDTMIGLDWTDKWNKPRVTNMTKAAIQKMISGTEKFRDYYNQREEDGVMKQLTKAEANAYRKEKTATVSARYTDHPITYISPKRYRIIKRLLTTAKRKGNYDALRKYFKDRKATDRFMDQ